MILLHKYIIIKDYWIGIDIFCGSSTLCLIDSTHKLVEYQNNSSHKIYLYKSNNHI